MSRHVNNPHAPADLFRACSVLLYLANPEPAAIICYLDTYCPAVLTLTAGQIKHECSVGDVIGP